ncbi:MAG: hypothetical protein HRO68_05635 [Nitrosopumilus sp.]|nr:hypothetical protein [Nitrosopumilus sp.]
MTRKTTILTMTFFAVAIMLVPINANASIDDNFVAYFGFDGNVNDYSGNQNHGTITGSEQYRSGPMGTAFNMDGSSRITLDNESNFDFDIDNHLLMMFG